MEQRGRSGEELFGPGTDTSWSPRKATRCRSKAWIACAIECDGVRAIRLNIPEQVYGDCGPNGSSV